MGLSVIICTYNPANHIIQRCLGHVQRAMEHGNDVDEVIIVDNNSSPALSERPELQAYRKPPFRFVVEKEQGLTPARLRGIREAKSELLVFVDDDNFVADNFFAKGREIAEKNPQIGAYSGQVRLQFESEPESWTKKYWGLLVYREFDWDAWSNLSNLGATMPCGAGLFARRQVVQYYLQLHDSGKRNIQLDRKGGSLFSGGDNDLAACACDIGMGVGLFHQLIVDHYIPKDRLSKGYLLKLARGISASSVVLKAYRGQTVPKKKFGRRLLDFLVYLSKDRIARQFMLAEKAGVKEGMKIIDRMDVKLQHR